MGNQSHRNKIVPIGIDSNYHTEPINENENADAEGDVIVGNQTIQDGANLNNEVIRVSDSALNNDALINDPMQLDAVIRQSGVNSAVDESVEIAQDIRILHNNYETQLRQVKSAADSRHQFTESNDNMSPMKG